jgi:hypothetical protein
VITNPTTPIEKIGHRLLRITGQLFNLPVQDEQPNIFREMTTIPTIRFSEILEPVFVRYEPDQAQKNQNEVAPESGLSAITVKMIKPANSFLPGIFSKRVVPADRDANKINAPQKFFQRPETREEQPASPSLVATWSEVAKVLQAMANLNLPVEDSSKKVAASEAPRSTGQPMANSLRSEGHTPHHTDKYFRASIADRGDDDRHQELIKEQSYQSSHDLFGEIEESSKRLPAESGSTNVAPPKGFRMAQGAPRIAALLQAGLVRKNEEIAETIQLIENKLVINSDEETQSPRLENYRQSATRRLDVEQFVEMLAEQLEFDLIRTYGTSRR